MGEVMLDTKMVNNTRAKCYEYYFVGELAAFVDYKLHDRVLSLIHTEVIPQFEGKGMAATLVRGILDEATAEGLQVLPYCTYVSGFISKHRDEYLELVPAGRRIDFSL